MGKTPVEILKLEIRHNGQGCDLGTVTTDT